MIRNKKKNKEKENKHQRDLIEKKRNIHLGHSSLDYTIQYTLQISGDVEGEHHLPQDCAQDGHRALDVDHDALDEGRDHHELDALALHNLLVSPSMP